jgi:hypothetical protein
MTYKNVFIAQVMSAEVNALRVRLVPGISAPILMANAKPVDKQELAETDAAV